MRPLRIAAPCQLSLGLLDLPVSACLCQSLPEEIRHQVLGLLARMIANGALADTDNAVTEVRDA